MDIGAIALALLRHLALLTAWVLVVGGTAPRWPSARLAADRGPLRLTRFDTIPAYRRWRVAHWGARLPEAGHWFGGTSKRVIPDRTPAAITAHLVELRRAEWVHWLANLGLLPLLLLGWPWLWAAVTAVSLAVNLLFIAILRHNRLRLYSMLERSRRGA